MKRMPFLRVAVGLGIAVGWWFVVNADERAIPDSQATHMSSETSTPEYVGAGPLLRVRFRYPTGWMVREEQGRGERYQQVRIMGPQNRENSYRCYLAVLASPLKSDGGRFESVEELVTHYTNHLQAGAAILASQQTLVGEILANDLTVEYTLPPWRFHGVNNPVEVPVKARTLMLQHGSTLYQVTFSADAREYDHLVNVMDQLVRTIQFQ